MDTPDRKNRALRTVIKTMFSNWFKPETRVEHRNDGAFLSVFRERVKSGTIEIAERLRLGPNHVHAFITHADGTITDCGISRNLLTNIGRDWMCQTIGAVLPAGGAGSPATAITSSAPFTITATGTPWTASNLATPQLGLAGSRIYASVTGVTTPPVYGNIISNTSGVATIDQWWTATDTVGTTPSSTCGFIIGAGGQSSARFMGLTTDAGAAAAADTVLATEITSGGCARALATYAHTMNAATFTLQKAFSVTSSFTAIHKMGLFPCLTDTTGTTAAKGGPMIFETVLNADATVVNGDTLTVTDTVTCSG